MKKAYSVNQEEWNYTDASEVLEALRDDGRLVEGQVYWESDTETVQPERFLSVERLLEDAEERMYDELGEVAEDAFSVSVAAKLELDELLKAWTRKHVTDRYWIGTGKVREVRVTAADVAEYAP